MLKLFWPHNWHWWDTLWGDLCCNILSSAKPPTVQSYVAPLIMCDVSYIIPSWCWHRVSVQTASQHTIFNFECSMNFHCHCIFFFTNKVLDLHISWSLKTFSSRVSCFSFLHFGIVEKFCGQADIVESLNVQLCLSCIYVSNASCFVCHRLSLWQIFIGQGFCW